MKQMHVHSPTLQSDHTESDKMGKRILNMIEGNNKIFHKQMKMVIDRLQQMQQKMRIGQRPSYLDRNMQNYEIAPIIMGQQLKFPAYTSGRPNTEIRTDITPAGQPSWWDGLKAHPEHNMIEPETQGKVNNHTLYIQ